MSNYLKAARVSDVPKGGSFLVRMNGRKVVLFNIDGNFHALDNSCPHSDGPICEGRIEGDKVICPRHSWEFDIKSGRAKDVSGYRIRTYPLKLDGDEILIEV